MKICHRPTDNRQSMTTSTSRCIEKLLERLVSAAQQSPLHLPSLLSMFMYLLVGKLLRNTIEHKDNCPCCCCLTTKDENNNWKLLVLHNTHFFFTSNFPPSCSKFFLFLHDRYLMFSLEMKKKSRSRCSSTTKYFVRELCECYNNLPASNYANVSRVDYTFMKFPLGLPPSTMNTLLLLLREFNLWVQTKNGYTSHSSWFELLHTFFFSAEPFP